MIIIIDTREKLPLDFRHIKEATVESGTIQTGDYSIKGLEHLFSIERKSIPDLVGSLTTGRDRFERELHRLRGYRFKRLLIIGHRSEIEAHKYRSKVSPNSILASLNAFEVRYDIPFIFANGKVASDLVYRWAFWFNREIIKTAEKAKGE
jgi:ERCC4-type nuclease